MNGISSTITSAVMTMMSNIMIVVTITAIDLMMTLLVSLLLLLPLSLVAILLLLLLLLLYGHIESILVMFLSLVSGFSILSSWSL